MRKIQSFFIMATVMLAISCNRNTGKTNETETANTSTETKPVETKPIDNPPAGIEGCYMQVLSRDTFAASLQQQGNKITGKLSFDNYQKDGSTGTVTGKLDDGIIKLFYSFSSEGMNSVMEVYFKQENDKLIRGTGDMDTKGDTAYFTNAPAIKYDGSALQKLPCASLPTKYK